MENTFFKGITVGFVVGYFFGTILGSSSHLRTRTLLEETILKCEELTEAENAVLQDIIAGVDSNGGTATITGHNGTKIVQKLRELGYSVRINSLEKNENISKITIYVTL